MSHESWSEISEQHRWLCHPGQECQDGCDANPVPARVRHLDRLFRLSSAAVLTGPERIEWERLNSSAPASLRPSPKVSQTVAQPPASNAPVPENKA